MYVYGFLTIKTYWNVYNEVKRKNGSKETEYLF